MVTLFFFLKNNVTEIFFFILKERKDMYNVDFFYLRGVLKMLVTVAEYVSAQYNFVLNQKGTLQQNCLSQCDI